MEAAKSHARIDLDMRPHARRALDDGFFQGAAAPRIHIVLGEHPLGRCDFGDGFFQRSMLRGANIQNA